MAGNAKIDRLARAYENLTPYERACLFLREADGRRRKDLLSRIATCSSPWDAYWTAHWEHAIRTVAVYAVHAATQELLFSEAARADGREHVLHYMKARAWIDALRQLEEETAAPFASCESLLPPPRLLHHMPPADDIPHAQEYRILRLYWDAFCDNPNRGDRPHMLSPLPPVDESPEAWTQWDEWRRVAEALHERGA